MRTSNNSWKNETRNIKLMFLAAITFFITLCSFMSFSTVKANAASTRCYTIADATTSVYNSSLTKIGSVYGEDELQILSSTTIDGKEMYKVRYYITGTSKTKDGYIYASKVVLKTSGTDTKASGNLKTYIRPNGKEYGSIDSGESIVKLGSKDGWTQIKYWSTNGYYKIGWLKPSSTPTTQSLIRGRLDKIASGSLKYDSKTIMTVGKKFSGTRATEQCKGYAKNCFYLCFKVTPGSTQSKPNNHLLKSTTGMKKVGSVTSMTKTNISNLFGKARSGDFVQMRRTHGGSHSAIVYKATSSSVTFLEANLDGNNTIYKKTYSWKDLCDKNAAMSVYTATSYSLK